MINEFCHFLAPDRVPENLGLSNKTSTSCVLSWDGVTNTHIDPDGAVTGYYIYYRKAGSNDTFDEVDVTEANKTVFTVGNLEKYAEYEFRIVAYNIYGKGNASDTFHCKTAEDGMCSLTLNDKFSQRNAGFFLTITARICWCIRQCCIM